MKICVYIELMTISLPWLM